MEVSKVLFGRCCARTCAWPVVVWNDSDPLDTARLYYVWDEYEGSALTLAREQWRVDEGYAYDPYTTILGYARFEDGTRIAPTFQEALEEHIRRVNAQEYYYGRPAYIPRLINAA